MSLAYPDRYRRALFHQPVDRPPVWFMRQAGRYLPEYRALRAQVGDFMTLCRDADLACEVALQPLRRFDLDAAILFSDILTIPDAMGLGLRFIPGEGPQFKRPLRSLHEIQQLPIPDPEIELGYVMAAVRRLRHALQGRVPLIGFAGSPWTLAAYMLEGQANRSFPQIRQLLVQQPAVLHSLLAKLAESVRLYLNAQIQAGAQAIMLFDTWGGLLDQYTYREFSLDYLQQIVDGLQQPQDQPVIPVTLFTKGGGAWLEQQALIGCQGLGIDEQVNLVEARRRVGNRVALQGNLDIALLNAPREQLQQAVKGLITEWGADSGYIFNLSHGIPPDVQPEQIQAILEVIQGSRRQASEIRV